MGELATELKQVYFLPVLLSVSVATIKFSCENMHVIETAAPILAGMLGCGMRLAPGIEHEGPGPTAALVQGTHLLTESRVRIEEWVLFSFTTTARPALALLTDKGLEPSRSKYTAEHRTDKGRARAGLAPDAALSSRGCHFMAEVMLTEPDYSPGCSKFPGLCQAHCPNTWHQA